MNEKIPLKKLAEKVASLDNCSLEMAEATIKSAFNLLIKNLENNSRVVFPGLGTFEKTGIASDPVKFTADSKWASTVNAPFAMFSSEEIPEEIDLDILMSSTPLDTNTVATKDEETETDLESHSTEEEELIDIIEQEPITKSETISEPIEKPIETENIVETNEIIETDNSDNYQQNVSDPDILNETIDQEEAESGDGFKRGFIIGLIVGLAIGALALCCYVFYYVNTSPTHTSVEEKVIESDVPELVF